MRSKRRLGLLVVVVLAAIGIAASAAVISQAKENHDIDATALTANVRSLSGGKSIVAGYVKGDPYGKGAVILKNKSTPNADGTATQSGKFTFFGRRGTASGTAEGKVTPTTGGNATFEGTGEFTSGTGKFKGSTGDMNITGTYDSGTGVLTLHATGSVKY